MSKKPVLTPWFPSDIQPARNGVYELRDNGPNRAFAYWNGERFCYRCWAYARDRNEREAASEAFRMADASTCLPPLSVWRGLAKEPK